MEWALHAMLTKSCRNRESPVMSIRLFVVVVLADVVASSKIRR